MGGTCIQVEPIVVVSPVGTFRVLLADEIERVGRPLVHAVESVDEALQVAAEVNPQLIVVDCTALRTDWLGALGGLRQAAPDGRIAVLGDEDEASYEREINHCRGCSYHSKIEPLAALLSLFSAGEQ